ncbi:hypothetical protein WAB17_02380 [Parerythrobacter aurantius]|uniref:hypothetical protein n=1 Tax=Parerythrobacter aurantius TaxID=3127706 RepID=UPI003249E61F
MKTLDITVTGESGAQATLKAPDIATALAVADINACDGEVAISRGKRPLARLRKREADGGGFWEVNP